VIHLDLGDCAAEEQASQSLLAAASAHDAHGDRVEPRRERRVAAEFGESSLDDHEHFVKDVFGVLPSPEAFHPTRDFFAVLPVKPVEIEVGRAARFGYEPLDTVGHYQGAFQATSYCRNDGVCTIALTSARIEKFEFAKALAT
jgi:hypothetical protein